MQSWLPLMLFEWDGHILFFFQKNIDYYIGSLKLESNLDSETYRRSVPFQKIIVYLPCFWKTWPRVF